MCVCVCVCVCMYRLAAIVKRKNTGNSPICPRHFPVRKITAEFMLYVPRTIIKG